VVGTAVGPDTEVAIAVDLGIAAEAVVGFGTEAEPAVDLDTAEVEAASSQAAAEQLLQVGLGQEVDWGRR